MSPKNQPFLFSPDEAESKPQNPGLKILIVDDEPEIHQVTRLALKNFSFEEGKLEFLSAYSAAEAKQVMAAEKNIALIFLDVIMETDNAGLEVVDYVRNELGNDLVRIILRTGHPGQVPELKVIENYDINDYKEKTELTKSKLYTVVRTGLKAYRNLKSLNNNKKALEYIIQAAPRIYEVTRLDQFFKGILLFMTNLLKISENSFIVSLDSFIGVPNSNRTDLHLCAGTGEFDNPNLVHKKIDGILAAHREVLFERSGTYSQKDGSVIIPIRLKEETVAVIFIEGIVSLNDYDKYLLDILASQSAVAFNNIDLYETMVKQHDGAINMLAKASEGKDQDTGLHIKRVQRLTYLIARELGQEEEDAKAMGQAAILHDVGKIAIDGQLLKKPSQLSTSEFEEIKTHTLMGKEILDQETSFGLASEVALNHHERFDGTGYPNGIKGETIPLSSRITALVDVFDALSHQRPYKEAWDMKQVLAYLGQNSGSHFDPQVVEAFMKIMKRGDWDPTTTPAGEKLDPPA